MTDATLRRDIDVQATKWPLAITSPRGMAYALVKEPGWVELTVMMEGEWQPLCRRVKVGSRDHRAFAEALGAFL